MALHPELGLAVCFVASYSWEGGVEARGRKLCSFLLEVGLRCMKGKSAELCSLLLE